MQDIFEFFTKILPTRSGTEVTQVGPKVFTTGDTEEHRVTRDLAYMSWLMFDRGAALP